MNKRVVFLLAGLLGAAVLLALWRPWRRPLPDDPGRATQVLFSRRGVDKPNVIVFTLDTTRADHLSCYGYRAGRTPTFDALAKRGIVFEQCITSSPLTLPAHCTILTGLFPTFHGVRINGNAALSDTHTTLAELFHGRGYACGAFIGAFVLDGRWGLKQGFDHYDDNFDLQKYKQLDLGMVQRPADQVIDAALPWLEERGDKPFFAWLHLYDPHTPYAPPPPFAEEFAGSGRDGLYDGEIAFMDEQIGRCLRWLEEKRLLERTILVFVGDHGEGLGEHGEQTHGYYIYDYAVHVPFLLVTPFSEFAGRRVAAQVRTADLYPTLAELAGIPLPAEVQGRSVLPLLAAGSSAGYPAYSESLTPELQYGWAPLHALREKGYKYISAPHQELYDLRLDRAEARNLYPRQSHVAARMRLELAEWMKRSAMGAPAPQSADLDKETVQRLAALGYIGGPVKSPGRGLSTAADPKDKQVVYEAVMAAGMFINENRYADAAARLEEVRRSDPDIPQAVLLLATCYTELGRRAEARGLLDELLKKDAENIQALIGLANVLVQEGRGEDVLAVCRRALSVDPRNTQAYTLMGEVFMNRNQHAAALPYLQKAVEIQPKIIQTRQNLAACLIGLKRGAEAEPMLREIVARNPKFPLVHFHLGLLLEERGREAEARREYESEIAAHAGAYPARFNLAKLLLRGGDLQGYLQHMREMVRQAPQVAEGHLFLARGLLLAGEPPQNVLPLVETGLKLAGEERLKALSYFLLADLYNRLQRPDKAREALRQAGRFQGK